MIGVVLSFMVVLGIFTFTMIPMKTRWHAVFALVLLMVYMLISAGVIAISGTPRPSNVDFFTNYSGKVTVLGATVIEDVAIYVWIVPEGEQVPVAIKFPYTQKFAEQLQDAMREGQATGEPVMMDMKMEGGLDERDPKFYAEPQEPNPDKQTDTSSVPGFRR